MRSIHQSDRMEIYQTKSNSPLAQGALAAMDSIVQLRF